MALFSSNFSSMVLMLLLGFMMVDVTKSTRGATSRRGGRGRGVKATQGAGTSRGVTSDSGATSNTNERDVDQNNQAGNHEENGDSIIFEKAERGISRGHYPHKPKQGEPKHGVVHFCGEKSIVEPMYKKTAKSLLRAHWSGVRVNQGGQVRESFLQSVVDEFREYYDYQEGYTKEQGDEIVKSHLSNSVRQNMYKEKEKADIKLAQAISKGETGLTRRDFPPHYLTEDTWTAMNDYWESPLFKRYSKKNTDNRAHKKLAHSTGAKPFDVIREELEVIEGKPVTDLKMFEVAYQKKGQPKGTLTNQAAVEYKEKLQKVFGDNAESDETLSLPECPIERKKRIVELTLQAQGGPKRGRVLLHPRHNVTQLLGPDLAAQWSSQQTSMQKTELSEALIKRAFNDVMDLGESFKNIDIVSRAILNEELRKLADDAVPNKDDISSQALWDKYFRQIDNMLESLFKRLNKVVEEDITSGRMEFESEEEII